MMNYLKVTKDDVPCISANDTGTIKWHADATYTVHKGMKSHTGATMTLGSGTICSISKKQKVNTWSSTEAKLVGFDYVVSKILWSKLFIEAQGFEVKGNNIFHIKFFYITNLINRNQIQIKYCPTEDMITDYMTKPLVGVSSNIFANSLWPPI